MSQYDKIAKEYSQLQNIYYNKYGDESRKVLYSLIGSSLKSKHILDMGCGFGKDLDYFQSKGAIVYGIDISKKMIEVAGKQYSNLTNLSVQNIQNTNFSDMVFDVVFSRFAIQENSNIESIFKEVYRILKPGGIFVFLVGHPFMQYLCKNNKDYWNKKNIKINLFESKISINEPSHTFYEYLSPFVLKHFEILYFYEGPTHQKQECLVKDAKVPDYFIMKVRKRKQ